MDTVTAEPESGIRAPGFVVRRSESFGSSNLR